MARFGYNVPPRTQRVVCNCGRETLIIMNPLNNAYRPEDKSWKWHRGNHHGWYCGTEGHIPKKSQKRSERWIN